jgi:methyl-accepting chemotaxis protein
MFMLALIAIVLSIVITTITSRTITRPLKAGVETMSDMAGGNLAIDIVVTGKDETGQLLAAMKKMADNLKAMITSIQMSAQSVASASEELSASSEQMSRGVAAQSVRASQIATSTSEMSQTIVDIAKNAANIASAAEDSTTTAKDGQSVVGKSVEEVKEMGKIGTHPIYLHARQQ